MKGELERYRSVIPDFHLFEEALRRPKPTHIRLNPLKADPEELRASLERKGISLIPSLPGDVTLFCAPGRPSAGKLIEYELGYLHPQALTSCLVSLVVAAREGTSVLDLCASPGGKCSHMAQFMKNTGLIVANEPYRSRHAALGHTLDRLGVLNAVLTDYPAQEFPLRMRFDRVLADVPCSGEGRFPETRPSEDRREAKWRERLVGLQKRIILRAFDLLRPEGVLVYSTCTYNPEENEAVVDHLLKNRQARLFPVEIEVPFDSGLTHWNATTYDDELKKTARFYPHRVHSVGFFMARIGRRN